MSKVKPWLLLAVIFIAGMVAGAALTIALAPHGKRPQGLTRQMMDQLTKQLDLTPDQQAKVLPILTDSSRELLTVRREQFEKMSKIIEKTNQQLAGVLTPEQQAKLAKMQKEMEENRDKMFPGRKRAGGPPQGPGPGGPPPGTPPPGQDAPPPPQ